MKYADTSAGNYENDASLKAIEDTEDGFGIPGTSEVGIIGGIRFADISNEDENSTRLTALGDQPKARIDVTGKPPITQDEGLSSVTPGSLGTIINGVSEGKKMSMDARIAYIVENGEPFCNHCERHFVPTSLIRTACTYCGCGRPNDDHGLLDPDFEHVEGETVADEAGDKKIIKENSKNIESTEDYLQVFASKTASDSSLYYQGYNDAMAGKPLDEDLAVLSDDYYNGYQQYKFYNKTPQESVKQVSYDIKPNSNQLDRNYKSELTPGEVDRGPLELTDGFNHATASKLSFPVDVIEKFFEV
jgi:hypothetical protein